MDFQGVRQKGESPDVKRNYLWSILFTDIEIHAYDQTNRKIMVFHIFLSALWPDFFSQR